MSHRLLGRFSLHALLLTVLIAGTAWAADTVFHFDIPSQSLASALRSFGQTAGEQIIFTDDLVAGMQSATLRGEFSAAAALQKLLAGTGLRAERSATGVLMIRKSAQRAGAARIEAARPEVSAPPQGLARVGQVNAGPQVGKAKAEEKKPVEALEEVVVTGTHIAGATPATPLTVLDSDLLKSSGFITVGEALRDVPQSFGGGMNSGVFGAQGAANQGNLGHSDSPNLRGYGSDATLVLLDGQRLPYTSSAGASDVSLIPLSALERIEVLTDGASAIYGSDAVGGVVNLVLRRNYSGVEATAQLGQATAGGAATRQYNVLAGDAWTGGSALLDYQYSSVGPVLARDRSYAAQVANPTWLLPQIRQNSAVGTLRQAISDSLSLFAEGFYANKAPGQDYSVPGVTVFQTERVEAYLAVAGIAARLPQSWELTGTGTYGRDKMDSAQVANCGPILNCFTSDSTIHNDLRGGELTASGPLASLPGGALAAAAGAGYRKELFTYKQAPDDDATRQVSYGFVELKIPTYAENTLWSGFRRLEFSAAARYEHYSDFGNNFAPRFTATLGVLPELTIRASWSRAFKAPLLVEEHGAVEDALALLPDPLSPASPVPVLYRSGPNAQLSAETATPWTVGFDFQPQWLASGRLSLTYFSTDFRNRVVEPINPISEALLSAAYSPFVVRNPSPALQQSVLAMDTGGFFNLTGQPYDPTTVAALVDDRFANAAIQRASGVDLAFRASWSLPLGTLRTAADASWLRLTQQLVPNLAAQTLSGTVFNPPRFKGRALATWTVGGWDLTGAANYISTETDNLVTPSERVASFTTIDAQIAYSASLRFLRLQQVTMRLSCQNLFNTAPPNINPSVSSLPGINYDSTNASPLGRFVSLSLSAEW